jgi:hypothetical protein
MAIVMFGPQCAGDESTPPAPLALPQRAYVWQRDWTETLGHDVATAGREFAGIDVLADDISWNGDLPDIRRVDVDWEALRKSGRPIGVVIRIGPRAGKWEAGSADTHAVIDTCLDALARARTHGLKAPELQLDFDAATNALDAYRHLLERVRREVAPDRLVITALPDWMHTSAFNDLILAADVYVLQVHSLEKPGRIEDPYHLFDAERATRWIEAASDLRRPFRIALPTYGYRVDFDREGNFVALEAEGPPRVAVPARQQRLALADPTALADFVRTLLASPPAACEGISWFRFPSREDELAWSWPTLRAVMHGQAPVASLTLTGVPAAHDVIDLFESNPGPGDAVPTAFRLAWKDGRFIGADGLGGWRVERESADTAVVQPPVPGTNGILRPGEKMRVGWVRFNRAIAPVLTALP